MQVAVHEIVADLWRGRRVAQLAERRAWAGGAETRQ